MKRINPDEKKYLVYKVSDWGLYYFNDPTMRHLDYAIS